MTYETLTLKDLIRIAEWDGIDQIELIALLNDIDYDRAMMFADKVDSSYLDWYFDGDGLFEKLNKELVVRKIKIGSKTAVVPDEFKMEVFGKKLMINNLLSRISLSEKPELELIKLMPACIAIALVDKIEGKFSSEAIIPIAQKIETMPARVVYPLAMFFFRLLASSTIMNLNVFESRHNSERVLVQE